MSWAEQACWLGACKQSIRCMFFAKLSIHLQLYCTNCNVKYNVITVPQPSLSVPHQGRCRRRILQTRGNNAVCAERCHIWFQNWFLIDYGFNCCSFKCKCRECNILYPGYLILKALFSLLKKKKWVLLSVFECTHICTNTCKWNKNACKVGAQMQADTANSKVVEAINVAPDLSCE